MFYSLEIRWAHLFVADYSFHTSNVVSKANVCIWCLNAIELIEWKNGVTFKTGIYSALSTVRFDFQCGRPSFMNR